VKAEGLLVEAACELTEVSTSGVLRVDGEDRGRSDRRRVGRGPGRHRMHKVHDHLDDAYGSPRRSPPSRPAGAVDQPQARRATHSGPPTASTPKDGRRRKVRTTVPDVSASPPPDLVVRRFAPGEPDEHTGGDITYIPPVRARCTSDDRHRRRSSGGEPGRAPPKSSERALSLRW